MKQWLEKLKLAIINENIGELEKLAASMPSTQDTILMEQATSLLKEGVALCQEKQHELGDEISKLKTIKKYLTS